MTELLDTMEGRKGEWMTTYSGNRFFPLDPRAEDIEIEDIAQGLSNTCRYGGQCKKFYSVAEHCVLMANYMFSQDNDPERALVALLHDSSEAFLNDLPRAVKHAVGTAYKDLEDSLEHVIFTKYGLEEARIKHWKAVKEVDNRIVVNEKDRVIKSKLTWAFDEYKELEDTVIKCWVPSTACHIFLMDFHYYMSLLKKKKKAA